MGIRTVHAFGNQQVQDQRFATQNDKVLSLSLRSVKVNAKFSPTLQLVAAVGTALVLFVGGYGALNGWWQVGVLVVVTSYLKNMLSPMKTLAKLAPSFTQGAASAPRIADILDQPTDHQGTDEPLPDRVNGRIELRKVGLDYGTGRGPVFTDVDLTVTPGERISLLGDNGAGKSTLMSLIGGLYRPTTGQVLLDGHSVPDVPEHWLHQQVAMVLQDTFLFSGTLADNIRYGRPDATDAEVAATAEAALVSEFADELPDGLDTTVGTGGVGLSGGQRQRVGIARALLVDAPVVLLDEPTAGLDVHAEELVVQALARLVEGRTIIATTHRPAVTALATRTVYLRQGGVLDTALPEPASGRPLRHRHPPGHPRSLAMTTATNTRGPSTRRTKSCEGPVGHRVPAHGRRGGAAGALRRDQGASQGRAQGARRRPEGGHPDAGRHPPAAVHPPRLLPHPRSAGDPAGARRAGLAGPPARRGERHPVDTQRAATTARRPAAGVDRGPGGRRQPDRAGPARRP